MNINDSFRYLHIGLPDDVLRRKAHGDFGGAVRAIDRYLKQDGGPLPLKRCLAAQREMILRLPQDYPYTRQQALALVCQHIPDFTEAEFDDLVWAGRIDWIYDHGTPHYFDRFFESLCKTDAAFAQRAGLPLTKTAEQEENSARMIAQLRERGAVSCRIRCRASVQLKDALFRKGERVRAYLPLPCRCDGQSRIQIERTSPAPTVISPETAPQRVIFWEEVMEENHPFSVEFSYVRTARYVALTAPVPAPERPDFDTQEEPPHILFTPYLRELTKLLTEGAAEPLEQAGRFYDFITRNVHYSFMRPYFGLENIAENCARTLVGDCGVQTLLFIALCRCAGIPARWESGWNVRPDFCGAHDWARFYAAPYGWLYADPSFGGDAARRGDETRRKHYFGNLDPYRMTANTQFQAPFEVPKEHWRADPYDNQVGEMETGDRGLRYEEFERTKEVLEFRQL